MKEVLARNQIEEGFYDFAVDGEWVYFLYKTGVDSKKLTKKEIKRLKKEF